MFPVLAVAVEIGGSKVRTVYLLPMKHGLDQYIANRLTRDRLLEVVAAPGRADAIFTDRLGESFESALEKFHPTPKPPEPKAASASDEHDSGDQEKTAASKTFAPAPPPPPPSTFGSGKGTLFLVDANSRVILWSIYEKPTRFTPDDLDRTAKHVVSQLKQDLADR